MTDTEKAEYDDVVRQLMAKCEQLAAENTRLRSERGDALSVCQELYSDPTAPPALRLKAAGLALQFEVPKLMPERAPINATCEEYIPLAELIAQRRARCDQLLREVRWSCSTRVSAATAAPNSRRLVVSSTGDCP